MNAGKGKKKDEFFCQKKKLKKRVGCYGFGFGPYIDDFWRTTKEKRKVEKMDLYFHTF